jgi:hypothetical protein
MPENTRDETAIWREIKKKLDPYLAIKNLSEKAIKVNSFFGLLCAG